MGRVESKAIARVWQHPHAITILACQQRIKKGVSPSPPHLKYHFKYYRLVV
jgi:hypothetical protein